MDARVIRGASDRYTAASVPRVPTDVYFAVVGTADCPAVDHWPGLLAAPAMRSWMHTPTAGPQSPRRWGAESRLEVELGTDGLWAKLKSMLSPDLSACGGRAADGWRLAGTLMGPNALARTAALRIIWRSHLGRAVSRCAAATVRAGSS